MANVRKRTVEIKADFAQLTEIEKTPLPEFTSETKTEEKSKSDIQKQESQTKTQKTYKEKKGEKKSVLTLWIDNETRERWNAESEKAHKSSTSAFIRDAVECYIKLLNSNDKINLI